MANAWYPWQDEGQARKELVSLGQDPLLLPSHPPFEKLDSIYLALTSSYAGIAYAIQIATCVIPIATRSGKLLVLRFLCHR